MPDIPIEQAIYGGHDSGGYRFLARSAGFLDGWLAEVVRLCAGLGERPAGLSRPAALFARPLGALLPTKSGVGLWPATFAFGNRLGFDALVVPKVQGVEFVDYLREEQAGDYPEGRYELDLQVAAESGDQAGLDYAFARRSR